MLRTRREPPAATLPPESIVFALADGFAYGLDATAGAPLWQVPVGLASPFVPQPIAGEAAAIVFDARSNELVRLDSRSGAMAWRLDLRERVTDPPLVLGNQLAQVLPSGKLLMIALDSGELQATVNLGRPLAREPVHDESGRHLYVLSRQDCLFILTRDPLACSAVEYLGHLDGSIPCSPARLGRFLVIPENDSLRDSIWQILVLDDDGGKVRPVQELKVAGWTWQTPAASGQIVWATGDKAGFEAFAMGDYASKAPFRPVARLTPDSVRLRAGLRDGALGARALGGLGPSRQVRARPGARVDPAGGAAVGPGPGTGADPVRRQPDRGHIPGSRVRRRGALGNRSRGEHGRLEDGGRRSLADVALAIGRFARADDLRSGWPGSDDLARPVVARRVCRDAGAAARGVDAAGGPLSPPRASG